MTTKYFFSERIYTSQLLHTFIAICAHAFLRTFGTLRRRSRTVLAAVMSVTLSFLTAVSLMNELVFCDVTVSKQLTFTVNSSLFSDGESLCAAMLPSCDRQ